MRWGTTREYPVTKVFAVLHTGTLTAFFFAATPHPDPGSKLLPPAAPPGAGGMGWAGRARRVAFFGPRKQA